MEPIDKASIADGSLLLVDTAPIVYLLDGHPTLAARFLPIFERHARASLALAITTATIAEVLAGPIAVDDEALVRRYRRTFESWQVVELTGDIAESAARLRIGLRLKLPDAIQAASALAIGADALVTHGRDFTRLTGLRVLH